MLASSFFASAVSRNCADKLRHAAHRDDVVALAAQHELAAVAASVFAHLRRRSDGGVTGSSSPDSSIAGTFVDKRRVEILRHRAARPHRALRLHQVDERVAEQRGRHRRIDVQARGIFGTHHRQLHAVSHHVGHRAAEHLRQRHQVFVTALVGFVQQQRQDRRRERRVRVHARQPRDVRRTQAFFLHLARRRVAILHQRRFGAQLDHQRVEAIARIAERLRATRRLRALAELQVERGFEIAREVVAEVDRIRRDRIEHDRARVLRITHRVLLCDARAVGHAHQVDLRRTDRLAHRVEIADRIGRRVEAQVRLACELVAALDRHRARGFRRFVGIGRTRIDRIGRGLVLIVELALQRIRLARAALVDQEDVAVLA